MGLGFVNGCGQQGKEQAAPDYYNYPSQSATLEAITYLQEYFLYADRIPAKFSLVSGEALEKAVIADYGSIEGFVNSLGDLYTRYVKRGQDKLDNVLSGSSYSGIGILLKKLNDKFVVNYVLPDGPAKTAGLRTGDQIVSVEGIAVADLSLAQVTALIKGAADTYVNLTVSRNSQQMDFNIKRALLSLKDAYGETLADGIGYIKLTQFGYSATIDFADAYNDLPATVEGLVIDLRDNGGGELGSAVRIASYFVQEGKAVFWHRRRVGGLQSYDALSGIKIKLPVAVLVNGNSASASEIVTAALAEKAGAVTVGETTYGKGTMQTRATLDNYDHLYVTTAEFFTPTQKTINGVGLTPEVTAALADADFLAGNDTQLTAAVARLKAQQGVAAQTTAGPKQKVSSRPVVLPAELKDLRDYWRGTNCQN